MTALTLPIGRIDVGALRWALSFAVVAAAHVAAALTLQRIPASPDSGFLAGAAVVMIDLPETPAAMPTPPRELAPGPEEAPSEAAPPPKEEAKPPEELADVALPEPRPPAPQPPAEEKPATAPPSVAMAVPDEATPTAGVETPQPPSAAVLRWQSGLSAHIQRFKSYPHKALARGQHGAAKVTFRMDRDGRVLESHIVESSGSHDLDEALLSMIARAQPLPKPPPDVKPADLEVTFVTKFALSR